MDEKNISKLSEEMKKMIVHEWLAKQSKEHLIYFNDIVKWGSLDFFVKQALEGKAIPIGHMPYYVFDD